VKDLARAIGRWDLVALVLNLVIGAGIFGLPSRVYALAGVPSLLAYLVCAILVLLIILCFAEVSSRFDRTGGVYVYARSAFGPLVGFEMGWLSWLVRLTAFAALCNLFVDYLAYFTPEALAGGGHRAGAVTAVTLLVTMVNMVGVRTASWASNILTIGKLVPLVLLAVVGMFFVDPSAYSTEAAPSFDSFTASVVLLIFAFSGFESVVIPAGEMRDPRRQLPFALLVGLGVIALLYVAVQVVCIGVVPQLAASTRPLADAGVVLFGPAGASLVSLGALVSIGGTMNAVMLTAPRLLFAMADRRQLPRWLAATNRRFQTPHAAIIATTAGSLMFSLTTTFASAAAISTIIRLLTYAITCGALPVLRRRPNSGPPWFVVPAGDLVAGVSLLLIAWLFSSSSPTDLRAVAVSLLIGLGLYLCFARPRRLGSLEVAADL
jgi:amino acid transporter